MFFATGSFINSALQLVSNSKTFYQVEEPRTWKEAMFYFQERYTDLADLQSVNSPVSIMVVYSYLSSTQAWIGLFYDVRISGLSWSSGSIFTTPTWSTLPVFQDGICATVYSWTSVPALGAATCTAQKPFICYYDPAVGHRRSSGSTIKELTTLPEEAEVKIGGQTFIRIEKTMSWFSARTYCRNHYTDLANLQRVTDEEGKETIQSITNDVDAWIGLYFDTTLNNLTWSSGLGSSIPKWLQKLPLFGQGLCAGLRVFSNGPPQIYALLCHELKPFICFYDPSTERPPLIDTSSLKVTHPSKVTARTTSRPNTGTSTDPTEATRALASATWISQRVSHEPTEVSSGTCGFSPCETTTPTSSTVGLTALQTQEKVSIIPPATSAPTAAVTSIEDDTHTGDTATATQAQHTSSAKHPESKEKPAADLEHSFGILKADFTISSLSDPEEMKDQLLSEIQEVLKLILGHEEFTLKWVGFEVNKK
ncbi:putative C-type lectin domain family 20 member A isoform X1 [Peromyscus eremicus]|uniref:putative C-type lectin domain family 20 member A isoform X1 n=2 Tax=Peromyscus eremicus TaxID=42410 RepID=UPI0027DD98CD|nr:putative C-type lectin domain family 20 member A isoform X1 [Peromyscus eremicus]XP_059136477.1 putative C-type lectin domain family 20 member A isoform X1 [Peromyscus eremicus]